MTIMMKSSSSGNKYDGPSFSPAESVTTDNRSSTAADSRRDWQGLGGPIAVPRPDYDRFIDPTLDSCCQREQESNARQDLLKQALDKYDVVAERERRRRHLVQTAAFAGCRCCYDPHQDGVAMEYPALIALRAERALAQQRDSQEEWCGVIHQQQEVKHKASGSVSEEDDEDEYDYLLDEDLPSGHELKRLEEQRRHELEWEMLKREIALQHGFGAHRQMHPSRVLKAAGLLTSKDNHQAPIPMVVLHLFDPNSRACASLDLYLEQELAPKMPGTKFLRAAGRATLLLEDSMLSGALRRQLRPDTDLPVLVAIRDGAVVNQCPRLQGLLKNNSNNNGDDEIVESAVLEWLNRSGVLSDRPPLQLDVLCRIRPEEEALMDYLSTTTKLTVEEKRFDCGMPNCCKSFPHQHVGEKTDQQDGLVVSEQEVLGDV